MKCNKNGSNLNFKNFILPTSVQSRAEGSLNVLDSILRVQYCTRYSNTQLGPPKQDSQYGIAHMLRNLEVPSSNIALETGYNGGGFRGHKLPIHYSPSIIPIDSIRL
jgi:hypothetical protein